MAIKIGTDYLITSLSWIILQFTSAGKFAKIIHDLRGDEEEKRNMLHWSFMNLPYHSHGRVIKEYKTHTCDQVIHFMNKKETDFSLLDSLPSAVTRMHRKEWLSTQDEPGGEY